MPEAPRDGTSRNSMKLINTHFEAQCAWLFGFSTSSNLPTRAAALPLSLQHIPPDRPNPVAPNLCKVHFDSKLSSPETHSGSRPLNILGLPKLSSHSAGWEAGSAVKTCFPLCSSFSLDTPHSISFILSENTFSGYCCELDSIPLPLPSGYPQFH